MPRHYSRGDFLPSFQANSSVNPTFSFDTLAGNRLLLVFLASAGSELGRATANALLAEADWLKSRRILTYVVTADPRDRDEGRLAELAKRFTIFWYFDRAIHRLLGMEIPSPDPAARPTVLRLGAYVVRENLRAHALVSATPAEEFGRHIRAAVESLAPPAPLQAMTAHAPVLIIPEVIDRALCRRLIDFYEERGGNESGFMRDIGGETRGLLDPKLKRRRDRYIDDETLMKPLRQALERRVVPEIRKAFGYRVTRVERYLVGCYDETDRGFFRAHRDNVSKATAHRVFAMSLNLNSEEYEGGSLRLPEYGPYTYKPDTGSAVVFSCSLLHEAMPVTRGRRYVVLPFLYDDRGAAMRAENRRFLRDDPATPAADGAAPPDTGGAVAPAEGVPAA